MRKCIKIATISLFVLFFIVFLIFVTKKGTNIKTEKNAKISDDIYEVEKKYHEYEKLYEDFDESRYDNVILLIKKNGDWSKIPLSENFRKKYNEKDGVLGKEIEFDTVEYRPYETGNYGFTDATYFVISSGYKKTAYKFSYRFAENIYGNSVIDDIVLSKPIVFVDENGKAIDTRIACDSVDNWNYITTCLLANDVERVEVIGFSKKWKDKYNSLFDALVDKIKPSKYNFYIDGYANSYENLTLDCKWKVDGIENIYRIHFLLDGKKFIDEIEVNIIQ